MHRLADTAFAALPARADVSQASFARLTGYTARQVNNWCRARAAVPPCRRAALGVLLQNASPEAIQILLEEVQFSWHETLGVPPNADAGTIRRAWAKLAHVHHPDKSGTQEQKGRLNAAYQRAGRP
jgi:DnaJ-domain-containing protein 1